MMIIYMISGWVFFNWETWHIVSPNGSIDVGLFEFGLAMQMGKVLVVV